MRGVFKALLALVVLASASAVHAYELTPIDEHSLVVHITTEGDTPEEAMQTARVEAIRGAAGRVLMSDQLIMADGLLHKYLGNYAADFVKAVEVVEEDFVQGRNRITAKVFVDFERLSADMADKRFLYKPAYRPRFATFMTEKQDDRIVNEGLARDALATAMNNLGMRRFGRDLNTPPPTTDVSIDDFLLESAIVTSQRAGVEVILTGESSTILQDQQKLYFDEYWFYETEMSAKLVRVDTGEVLVEARAKGSASDTDPTVAIEAAIARASERVASQLVPPFEEVWPRLVQRKSDYEVLLTGVDSDLVSIIREHMKRIGIGTQVYVRKEFDRTASIAVDTDQSREAVIENIRSCTYPTLSVVNPDAERVFEVQVSS